MIPGRDLVANVLLAGPLADPPDVAIPQAWAPVVLDDQRSGQYLVEIDAFSGVLPLVRATGPGGGIVANDLVAGPTQARSGDATVRRLEWADRDWIGAPDDPSRPNDFYDGRVLVPLRVRRSIPIEPEDDAGITREYGDIAVAAADGALDTVVPGFAVDGRRVRVLFGPYMGEYGDFRPIADCLGDRWENDGDIVRLWLRDRAYALDKPLQERVYQGTGGGEGTDELEGRPLPRVWGRVRNVTPDFVDPINLVYRINDRATFAVDAVYDRGAALNYDQDYASEAALLAASVPAGEFATCLAEGLFKLGAPPDGLVTCDVRGTISPTAGGYVNTVDQICLAILREDAALGNDLIDRRSFADLAVVGGEMGWHIPSSESPSFSQTLREICRSVGGFFGVSRLGLLRAGRLQAPEAAPAQFTFDEWNAVNFRLAETIRPRFRQRVAFRRNYTVQRGEDLAAAVSSSRRQELAEEWRVATEFRGQVRVRNPEALDPELLVSPYERREDAEALAASLMDRHGVDRQLFELTVRRASFLFNLGDVVRVSWPRLATPARNYVIVDMDEDTAAPSRAGGTVEQSVLTLWG